MNFGSLRYNDVTFLGGSPSAPRNFQTSKKKNVLGLLEADA